MFKRVLIANRGEIAIRIARAAASLGIELVAVFTPADAQSLHTKLADKAVEIGKNVADPLRAYLDIEAIIAAAKESGADCIHPGYGFLVGECQLRRALPGRGPALHRPLSCRPRAVWRQGGGARLRADRRAFRSFRARPARSPRAQRPRLLAQSIGYPVMLKASAGGGGRGMRIVTDAAEMDEAFARCQGEAQAAFGNGAVFLEKIVPRPRHIEVQVLGDGQGNVVHLFERDCSVQLRHQKVVEIAPAPGLDDAPAPAHPRRCRDPRACRRLRERRAPWNSWSIPESGEHFFIECNPRIQVEHTITEQVMGWTSSRRSSGSRRVTPGGDRHGRPGGASDAARIRNPGAGGGTRHRDAHRLPRALRSGRAGRCLRLSRAGAAAAVRSSAGQGDLPVGFLGHVPSAVDRTERALAEFHIAGVPTNLAQLRAILANPAVPARRRPHDLAGGDAIEPAKGEQTGAQVSRPAGQRARDASDAARSLLARPLSPSRPAIRRIESPHAGAVVDIKVRAGDTVSAGQTLFVVIGDEDGEFDRRAVRRHRRKRGADRGRRFRRRRADPRRHQAVRVGTSRASPASGRELDPDARQGRRAAGDRPSAPGPGLARARRGPPAQPQQAHLPRAHRRPARPRQLPRGRQPRGLRVLRRRRRDRRFHAGQPRRRPGPHRGPSLHRLRRRLHLARRPCRRRHRPEVALSRPAVDRDPHALDPPARRLVGRRQRRHHGAQAGRERRKHRPRKAPARSRSASRGWSAAAARSCPATSAAAYYADQLATVPVVNMLLGSVVGIGAAKAVLGHFSVMVRDISQLFVAGPPVVSHAMGYDVTKEDLGGWHIHCRNGSVDNLAETEEEAMAQTRRFLSYLPSSVYEAPPVARRRPTRPTAARRSCSPWCRASAPRPSTSAARSG